MKGTLHYSSNNSGGYWWLDDADWHALEHQGWKVKWYKDRDPGDRFMQEGDRFLGGLASEASKRFNNIEEGIAEWERLTGQNAASIGCNCCGEPHSFRWEGDDGIIRYASISTPDYGELEFR